MPGVPSILPHFFAVTKFIGKALSQLVSDEIIIRAVALRLKTCHKDKILRTYDFQATAKISYAFITLMPRMLNV